MTRVKKFDKKFTTAMPMTIVSEVILTEMKNAEMAERWHH